MEVIYILLASIGVTVLIVYGIYRFTSVSQDTGRSRKTIKRDPEIEIDEEFLEERIDEGFKGAVYKKADSVEKDLIENLVNTKPEKKEIKKYPDCFGSIERYSTCKRDCGVTEECSSTINVLQGL